MTSLDEIKSNELLIGPLLFQKKEDEGRVLKVQKHCFPKQVTKLHAMTEFSLTKLSSSRLALVSESFLIVFQARNLKLIYKARIPRITAIHPINSRECIIIIDGANDSCILFNNYKRSSTILKVKKEDLKIKGRSS